METPKLPCPRAMLQSFFINGQFRGHRTLESFWKNRDGGVYMTSNYALYCPTCGEVWARITIDKPGASWNFAARPCRQHPHSGWGQLAGTLADPPHWVGSPLAFSKDWPDGAVQWEFQSLLANYERSLTSEQTIPG